MRQGTKSDLLHCLESCAPCTTVSQQVDAKVLDGPAIVHMLQPGACKTFHTYATDIVMPYINSQLDSVQLVDVVWDRYLPGSLKQSTRDARGTGIRLAKYIGIEERQAMIWCCLPQGTPTTLCNHVLMRKQIHECCFMFYTARGSDT